VDAAANIDRQVRDMQYAGLQAAIVSWWGQGLREGRWMPLLLSRAAGLGFSLSAYYEWGEGIAVESATAWSSASGHGVYADILHDVFAAHPR
jgi:hypothetical protein